jgi:hypothetical protein
MKARHWCKFHKQWHTEHSFILCRSGMTEKEYAQDQFNRKEDWKEELERRLTFASILWTAEEVKDILPNVKFVPSDPSMDEGLEIRMIGYDDPHTGTVRFVEYSPKDTVVTESLIAKADRWIEETLQKKREAGVKE